MMAPATISPFVRGFQEDVFLSYSHIDNTEGWVDDLHVFLLNRVRQLLGTGDDTVRFWRDPKLKGGDAIWETIEPRVAGSAVFVAIRSPRYLNSDGCRREAERFHREAAQQQLLVGTTVREVRVVKTPYDSQALPDVFKEIEAIEFRFFQRDPADETQVTEFPSRPGLPGYADFYVQANALAASLAGLLQKLTALSGRSEAPIARHKVLLDETTDDRKVVPVTLPSSSRGGEVFVSYAREDRLVGEAIIRIIEQSGLSVWWDRRIQPRSGATFDEVIDKALSASLCVLVLWSRASIVSPWVKAEAMEALDRGKLVQARLEDVRLPLVFRSYHCASLAAWNGDSADGDFPAIRDAIASFAASELLLPIVEAQSLIQGLAHLRRAEVKSVELAPVSPFGTASYRAKSRDGLGVFYCHASGKLARNAFYVRKGIGYYYEYVLGGSGSPLGLPVSNEELVDGKGLPTTYFEGGYIEWSPKTKLARAVLQPAEGEIVLGEKRL